MKKSFILLFFLSFMLGNLWAQCPGCAVDTTCAVLLPAGGICPDVFPPATSGVAYDEDVTFYMPIQVTDPGSGLLVDLLNIEIIGVQGLPLNLQWECGNSPTNDCIFTPPSNPPASSFGCIKFCGTPIVAPDTFNVIVNFLADVFVPSIGATLNDQPQFYEAELVVLPGMGGNNSFTFTPTIGCEDLDVDFEASLDFAPNQPTEYAWDFGNGNTSTLKNPPTETFSAGTYPVNLVTTVYNYVLTEVCVSSVNEAWCGDVEEPVCNCGTPVVGACPDIYVTLYDANSNAVFSSAVIDGATNGCWNGLNVILDNPPYTLSVFDEDPVSQDDNLGTFALSISSTGSMNYSSADGTIGNYTIGQAVNSTFNDTDTIIVNPLPAVPLISFDGSSIISVDNPDATASYQWSLDGSQLVGETDPSLTVSTSGSYTVSVINAFGCAAGSASETVIISSNKDVAQLDWSVEDLFPNPSSGRVTLNMNLDKAIDMEFIVLDPLGRKVWQTSEFLMAGSQQHQLNLEELSIGFYLLQVRSAAGQWTGKLVLNK